MLDGRRTGLVLILNSYVLGGLGTHRQSFLGVWQRTLQTRIVLFPARVHKTLKLTSKLFGAKSLGL